MRILLVEDDPLLAAGLQEGLERAGFAVDHLGAAEPAESALELTHYDLAIIDIGLPRMDGLELIRRVRRQGLKIPLLILSARDGLEDRVKGLDLGADDYLLKPFQLPELLARLRALLRRSSSASSAVLKIGRLSLDTGTHNAYLGDQLLELTKREWEILEHLVMATPKVVAKQKLVESLGQWDKELTANAIEIHVSRLRNKLDGAGVIIRTLRGIGYRLDESHAN